MAFNPNSIADTGLSLVNLLLSSSSSFSPGDIGLYSPGDIPETSLPKLTLFLYHISQDPSYVNQEMTRTDITTMRDPGMALELYYMIIPNSSSPATPADRALEEHKFIEHAIRSFRKHPLLKDPLLAGGLAGKGYEIRITFNPVQLNDLTNIWQAFQSRPMKLSVCYRVGPVFVEMDETITLSRVKSVQLGN